MDESERQTLIAALESKLQDVLRRRAELERERENLASRNLALDRELADLRAAARLFSVPIEMPKTEGTDDLYRHVLLSRSLLEMRHPQVPKPPPPPIPPQKIGGKVMTGPESQPHVPERPPIKDIVLDRLKEAGEKGSRASPIRDYIERVYNSQIHEKTVGMTLYRLSQEGLVRRKGFTWFFVPPKAETENPGVGAPGSESSGK